MVNNTELFIDELIKLPKQLSGCVLKNNTMIQEYNNLKENCKEAGSSDQKVFVCNNYVFKTQPGSLNRRVEKSSIKEKFNIKGIKVDPFTMNNIQHLTMMYINGLLKNDNDIYNFNDHNKLELKAESPLILCKENNATVMVDYTLNMDFQEYLTNYYQDKNYLYNIIIILKGIFLLQDKLYKLCQFHHCDMKCAQILLKLKIVEPQEYSHDRIEHLEKYTYKNNLKLKLEQIILSDFDKSTLTLLYENIPYRIRITKKLASYNVVKRYGVGIISGKLKIIDKSQGIQFYYRVTDNPLTNNTFFNYCLLSSTLLLVNSNYYYELIIKIRENKSFNLLYLDLNKIITTRKKEISKRKGNKPASNHVITKNILVNSNNLESKINFSDILTGITNIENKYHILGGKKINNSKRKLTKHNKRKLTKRNKRKLTKRNKRKNKYNRKVKSIKKHNKKIYKSKRK